MGLRESLYNVNLDRKDLDSIKDRIKKIPSYLKDSFNNPNFVRAVAAPIYNFLTTYIGLKSNEKLILGELYKPARELIEKYGIEKGLLTSFFDIVPRTLMLYSISSLVIRPFEDYMNNDHNIDIRNTLSLLPLDVFTITCLVSTFKDVYNMAGILAYDIGLRPVETISLEFPVNSFFGILAAGLVISPFLYSFYKQYSSEEARIKFGNLRSVIHSTWKYGKMHLSSALKDILKKD